MLGSGVHLPGVKTGVTTEIVFYIPFSLYIIILEPSHSCYAFLGVWLVIYQYFTSVTSTQSPNVRTIRVRY